MLRLALAIVLLPSLTFAKDVVKKKPSPAKQAMFMAPNQKANTSIYRSADDFANSTAAKQLGRRAAMFKDVDFKKSMIVVIQNGQTRSFGVKLTVQGIGVVKGPKTKVATVIWMYKPYFGGAAPPPTRGNPSVAAVVPRFDGKVIFKKTVYKWPRGLPLPPSAPPPSVPRLPR